MYKDIWTSKIIFSYRSSRMWCFTESASEVLVHRFCVFTLKILHSSEKVNTITLEAIYLYNMQRQKNRGTLHSKEVSGFKI